MHQVPVSKENYSTAKESQKNKKEEGLINSSQEMNPL